MDDWTLEQCIDEGLLKEREKRLAQIKGLLSTAEDTTLVLGSGISIPAGLPDWNRLLAELWSTLISLNSMIGENDVLESVDKKLLTLIKEERPTLDAREFKKDLTDLLAKNILSHIGYRETAEYLRQTLHTESLSAPFVNNVAGAQQEEMKDLQMVALVRQVLIDDFDEKGDFGLIDSLSSWARNYLSTGGQKGIARVITYNYDDLFEWRFAIGSLDDVTRKRIVSLSSEDCLPEVADGMEVHHVHGRIHIAPGSPFGEDSKTLVLTESSYQKAEKNSYDWLNSLQAYHLSRSRCIFVGFSAQDYNFKRILKNMRSHVGNTARHFMFVCVDSLVEDLLSYDKNRDTQDPLFRLLLNRIIAGKEIYWKNYGIIPIWTTKDEIGNLVDKMSQECSASLESREKR